MSKLKTLRDFKGSLSFSVNAVSIIALRQEAIREIKLLENVISNEAPMPSFNIPYEDVADWRGQVVAQITYIKWKNNLTEEDLLIADEGEKLAKRVDDEIYKKLKEDDLK